MRQVFEAGRDQQRIPGDRAQCYASDIQYLDGIICKILSRAGDQVSGYAGCHHQLWRGCAQLLADALKRISDQFAKGLLRLFNHLAGVKARHIPACPPNLLDRKAAIKGLGGGPRDRGCHRLL